MGGFTADFIYSEALKVIGLDRKKSIIRLVMSAAPTHNHAKSQKTFLHKKKLIVIDAPYNCSGLALDVCRSVCAPVQSHDHASAPRVRTGFPANAAKQQRPPALALSLATRKILANLRSREVIRQ